MRAASSVNDPNFTPESAETISQPLSGLRVKFVTAIMTAVTASQEVLK